MSASNAQIPRSQTPPLHTQFSARQFIAPNFTAFHPKNINTHAAQVAWNCDGRRLATCGYEKFVRLWSPEKSLDERNTTSSSGGFVSAVNCVAWNPTHPDLLCASSRGDKKICFWDVRQKPPTHTVNATGDIIQLEYAPDGGTIFAVERGDSDERSDALSFLRTQPGEGNSKGEWTFGGRKPQLGTVHHAKWNHVGDYIFLACGNGAVTILEYPSLSIFDNVGSHARGCRTLDLDPKGRYLATGGSDAIVNLFDVGEMICMRTIASAESAVITVAFSHDGEFVASSTESSYIDISATETGQHMHRINGPSMTLSLAWHPSKHALASAGKGLSLLGL